MARQFHRRERLGALTEINVTPLIDLAFALLIIFMITTPLLEQTIPLNLPLEQQSPGSLPQNQRFQTISVDRSGQVFWGDQPVTPNRLEQLLADLAREADPPVLRIRADGGIPYQRVIDVLDLIKQNRLSKISLDTQVK